MFRKLLKMTGYLVLVAFIIVTLAFSYHESRDVTCRNIEIDFRKHEAIQLSKDEIARLVRSADNKLIGKKLGQINTEFIEQEIEKHQAIEKAEVYKVVVKDSTSFKGVIGIKIKHKTPVVRIMSDSGSYYLDKLGGKVPISGSYTANVLVATGYISGKFATEQLLPFILFIEKDEFWKAQIEQVHVENSGDVLLTPLVGNHFIEMGSLENYQEKLRNMRVFYSKVVANNNWNKYESVSLKYRNQIIAKKR